MFGCGQNLWLVTIQWNTTKEIGCNFHDHIIGNYSCYFVRRLHLLLILSIASFNEVNCNVRKQSKDDLCPIVRKLIMISSEEKYVNLANIHIHLNTMKPLVLVSALKTVLWGMVDQRSQLSHAKILDSQNMIWRNANC